MGEYQSVGQCPRTGIECRHENFIRDWVHNEFDIDDHHQGGKREISRHHAVRLHRLLQKFVLQGRHVAQVGQQRMLPRVSSVESGPGHLH